MIIAYCVLAYIILIGLYFTVYRFGYLEYKNKNYVRMIVGSLIGLMLIVSSIIGLVLLSH